jgi:hypothetical protein
MGAPISKFKTAMKSCALVVVDQLHPFQNQQNYVIEYLPQFAERRNVLNLIELLESFGLTCHSRRGVLNLAKPILFRLRDGFGQLSLSSPTSRLLDTVCAWSTQRPLSDIRSDSNL